MPHTPRPTAEGAGLAPVPVAILLPAPTGRRRRRDGAGRAGRLSDHIACQLIARYTRSGEQVIDLDANPAIGTAAGWLERRHLSLTDDHQAPPEPARLVIATLPRPGATGLGEMTDWMRQISRRLLAPGGFLLAVVSSTGAGRHGDYATTIITAATAAGLSWHQHIVDIHSRLPEHEPRAEPDTAATTTPRLDRGRHRRVHLDLYAFTNAGGEDPDA